MTVRVVGRKAMEAALKLKMNPKRDLVVENAIKVARGFDLEEVSSNLNQGIRIS